MIISQNTNNINIAYSNQKKYNNLSKEEKDKWIDEIYNFYKSLPLIPYSKKDIEYSFEKLCKKQKYSIITDCHNYSQFEKYDFHNLINFIKNNNHIKNTINKKTEKFLNCNLIIVDDDYKKNYVEICALSDFYQNKERIKCKVLKYPTPYNYYKKNYHFVLDKYFKKSGIHYEKGLLINDLTFENNKEQYAKSINPLYLQNIIYENNRFCTVYKPYLFKLFVNIFKGNTKPKILDLSSGWGDRLIGMLSIQDEIEQYIGIDPNNNLFTGYQKMINDLCEEKNKKKFILLQQPAEEVDYISLDYDIDIIFWSPPFFDQELYVIDNDRIDFKKQSVETFKNYEDWEDNFLIHVIALSTNNLKVNGVLILYLGNINYDTFMKKMNNIDKIKYIGNINILGDKIKNYIIFVKVKENKKCRILSLNDGNPSKIKEITKKLKKTEDNPPLHIITLKLPNNNKINLIQDSVLITGTKQRVVSNFIKNIIDKNKDIKILTYSGSYNGYGGIATAYGAYKLGLESEVFLSEVATGFNERSSFDKIINSRQINTLLALGAKIHLCPDYRTSKNLEYDLSTLVSTNKDTWKNKKEYFNVPMGLNDNDKEMVNILSKQIKKASENTILEKTTYKRFWLVAGSGGISQSIRKAFPDCHLFLYLTGGGKYIKKVMEWINNNKNIVIVNNNPKYDISDVDNDYKKYYDSVENYDSQIWPYVKKYAKDGDFIWNVASD